MEPVHQKRTMVFAALNGIVHVAIIIPFVITGSEQNLTSLLILLLCLFFGSACIPLLIYRKPPPLIALFGLIYYVYFLIMPGIAQVSHGSSIWKSISTYDEAYVFVASIICIIGFVGLLVGYSLYGSKNYCSWDLGRPRFTCDHAMILALLAGAISVISLAYLIAFVGFSSLTSTRLTLSQVFAGSSAEMMIGLMVDLPRAVAGTALIVSVLAFRDCPLRCAPYFILVVIVNSIVNFPGSTARFILGAILISSLLVYVRKWNHQKLMMLWFFVVFALFAIFPIWGVFNRGIDFNFNIELLSPYSYLLTGDLDGFQSIVNVVGLAENTGHTFGLGLLSAVLFFVPRSLWLAKAEPTGVLAADFNNYSFTNISAPIFSEYYYDFGMVGVLVMCFLTGLLVARLEFRNLIFAAVIAGFVFIIMRGSFLGISRIPITVAVTYFGLIFMARFLAKMRQIRSRRYSWPERARNN